MGFEVLYQEIKFLRKKVKTLQDRAELAEKQRDAAVKAMLHIAEKIDLCDEQLLSGSRVNLLGLGRCDVCKKQCLDGKSCKFDWVGG